MLKAVILDLSGTIVDIHVLSPAIGFVKVFEKYGINVTMEEAREPMGLKKEIHLKQMLEMPRILDQWMTNKKYTPDHKDIDLLYKDLEDIQKKLLPKYCTLTPGTANSLGILRHNHDMKFGVTSGFNRELVDIILYEAAKQGVKIHSSVASDEVEHSRPFADMTAKNQQLLGIDHPGHLVKVDDTIPGIQEGLNNESWTVGVFAYSNSTGIDSLEQWAMMYDDEKRSRLMNARDMLEQANPHFIVPDITYLPWVVGQINGRLKHGLLPTDSYETKGYE